MSKAKGPKTSVSPIVSKTPKAAANPELFSEMVASWQLGRLDFEGEWGLNLINDKIRFDISPRLLDKIVALNDNELYDALDEMKGKPYESINMFLSHLNQRVTKDIPRDIIKSIVEDLTRNYFREKIHPKLRDYEAKTWKEIENEKYTGGGKYQKTRHHFIPVEKIDRKAQKRLEQLGINDVDELFSFRLDFRFRLWGIRKFNYYQIIWFDQDHSVYPLKD